MSPAFLRTTSADTRTHGNHSTSSVASSCTTFGRKGAKNTSTTATLLKKSSYKPGWRRWRSVWPLGRLLDLTALPETRTSNVALSLTLEKNGFTWTFSERTMPPFGGISFPPCTSWIILMIDGAVASLPSPGFTTTLRGGYIQMALFPATPKLESGNCPEIVPDGVPELWQLITPDCQVWLQRGLNQTCSPRRDLSKDVSHSPFGGREEVDSRLLVVGSQIANLTPGLSFAHNLGYKCPNDQCEAIFNIYASRPFQWHQ
jgi:hypothetical protein